MTTPTATIFLPYHAFDVMVQRGLRADQPDAADVVPGTLYCVLDEGNQLERSNGVVWELMGATGTGGIPGPPGPPGDTGPMGPAGPVGRSNLVTYSYSAAQTAPPGPEQVRFNAGFPYTAVTKVWVRAVSAEGQDVFLGLMIIAVGSTVLVQDANDHTMYARFRLTSVPIDQGAYVELPVAWVANGTSLGGGQLVLLQAVGGATAHGGTIGIVFDGGGSVITPGVKGFFEVGVACTISAVTLLATDAAATAGSIVVDIWKAPYASYPPTVANTITASAKPTLAAANKSQNTTLTGWTTAIAAGDILAFKVDSATTVTKVSLTLTVQLG